MKKYRVREGSPLDYVRALALSVAFVAIMILIGETTYLGM